MHTVSVGEGCPVCGQGRLLVALSTNLDELFVMLEGKTYAQVGDRLYTEHAVNRMQPSGLGAPAGELSPGRNISPDIVNEVISSGQPTYAVVDGVPRTVYWSGNVGVVTENEGNLVVTILRRGNQ